ncbi:hypothetical protein [Dactylosporangium salmoneum]|uniref:Uncharacterized protein n=1 Tax=Dactylosporangium salmoneum TaxID=53361 RepID=A0ABN3I0M3_9ACTN
MATFDATEAALVRQLLAEDLTTVRSHIRHSSPLSAAKRAYRVDADRLRSALEEFGDQLPAQHVAVVLEVLGKRRTVLREQIRRADNPLFKAQLRQVGEQLEQIVARLRGSTRDDRTAA